MTPRGQPAAESKTSPYRRWRVNRGMPSLGAHDWPGASESACATGSSRTCPVTSPPTPAMAAVIAHPQDTPLPVVSPPPEASEPLPDKISAYYSLVFPNFTYYLQTLNVTIGRRCVPAGTASTSDNPQVDVDLGSLKSVSRLHAKIEYDEDEERFVLLVLGRNGAWVDGVWSGSGSKVPLGDRYVSQPCLYHATLTPRVARRYRLPRGPSISSCRHPHLLRTLPRLALSPPGTAHVPPPLTSPRTRLLPPCPPNPLPLHTFPLQPRRYRHYRKLHYPTRTLFHTRRTARSARSQMHQLRRSLFRKLCHRSPS